MVMQIDVMALFIVVLLLIIVVFLVPTMIQVRTAMQRFDEFLRETQRDLLPMLRELREASEKLNRASSKTEEGVAKVGVLLDSLEEVGDTVHNVNSFLRHDVGKYVGNVAGLWLGFRSASKAFMKQLTKQKGGN
jgi:uncharacterized protein YoxC